MEVQDDDAAAANVSKSSGNPSRRITHCSNTLTTIIVQTVAGAKHGDYGLLTGLLHVERASKINYQSNPGDVLELLVASLGLDFSDDGTKLWRRAEPGVTLAARPCESANTRRPKDARQTTLGALRDLSLEHDAESRGAGGRAEHRAAEAARPALPRALTLAAPNPADRFTTRKGTGWGHRPKVRSARCIAEVGSIQSLVLDVQEHALRSQSW